MQILLIAATEQEIEHFTATKARVDIMITGIGTPSTLYHLQKRINQVEYDLIIQAGIAGSFNEAAALGKTVLVKQDCFADLGVEEKENFTTVFKAGLMDENEFPFEDGWLINPNKDLNNTGLSLVKAITVNKVSDSELQKLQYIQAFNADIETMEGAALHYVCLQENIPFLQIRSISNYVGERDKTKWKMKEAVDDLNTELTKLINQLKNT